MILLLFLLGPLGEVCAQRQIVLIKGNKIITRFSEGEQIRYRKKGEDFFRSGVLTGIYREYFKMGELDTTWIYEIRAIDMHGHPNSGFKTAEMGGKFILAGAILIAIDIINSRQGLDYGVIIVSSAFVATGVFMQFVNNNYFKVGRTKRVTVMGENKP